MGKHRFLFGWLLLACVALGMALSSCEAKEIPPEDLPDRAREFVQKHFPSERITYVERDGVGLGREYEVWLSNGAELEFDRKGSPFSLKCATGLPPSVLMDVVADYLASEHEGALIVEWEQDDDRPYHQEVTIRTGDGLRWELLFTSGGQFLRIAGD